MIKTILFATSAALCCIAGSAAAQSNEKTDPAPARGEGQPLDREAQLDRVAPRVGGGSKPISAAGLLGVGLGESPNPYGIGLGARLGYTFESHVYVGGTFVYHFGGTRDTLAAGSVTTEETNVYYVGAEAGYDVLLAGRTILRPYAGAGIEYVKSRVEVTGPNPTEADTSDNSLYLAPGVAVLAGFDRFFAGGDARYVVNTQQSDGSAFALMGTLGSSF